MRIRPSLRLLTIVSVLLLGSAGLVPSLTTPSTAQAATSTQVIAAGTSATNLATESAHTGAQNPPYICCWNQQGQFVTFSFTVAASQTGLGLRYSAGSGTATRKVELDGSVLLANQSFAGTGSWSTWATVSLNANLSAGGHTLKVWYDAPAGSSKYMNLDNLTVTSQAPPPPPAVPTNTGLPAISGVAQVPNTLTASNGAWTNSPTSFAYQWSRCNGSCTAVVNPNNTYVLSSADVGATIVVAVTASNATGPGVPASSGPAGPVTAASGNVVVAAGSSATNLPTENKFTGAQSPPYICCWNQQGQFVTFSFNSAAGATTLALRYSAAIGQATRKIELDGSVVAPNQAFPGTPDWNTWSTVTLGATLTAGPHTLKVWFDAPAGSQQWLNLDTLTISPGSPPPPPAPTNTGLPAITGTAQVGSTLTASTGTWTGSPTSYAYQWARCNGSCTSIANSGSTYTPIAGDVGSTITVAVTATNASGPSAPATSAPTSTVVATGSGTVAVALGYADSTNGLTPWNGSPNTIFIGGQAFCCSTHGPNNGGPTYDAGAMLVTNTGASPVVVNAVTVDIPTASGPMVFDLWGGGASGRLPQTLAPGARLVLTSTGFFNFDTSDFYGESCHFNTGGVPVVHVTVNNVRTDYQDSFQILNAEGTDKVACPGAITEETPFTPVVPGAQPPAAPVNDIQPSISGTAVQGRVMSGLPGGWNASPPPAMGGVWLRCDSAGGACAPLAGASSQTYRPTAGDVGQTLRFQVTGSNASGTLVVASAASAVVQAGPAVAQIGNVSTGFRSTFVVSTNEISSTFTAASGGTTTDFTFYARGAGNTQTFTPKIYSVVNGNKGPLLGTGAPVSVAKGADARWYVSNLPGVAFTAGAQYVLALVPSGIFNGTYIGSENNGQLSVFANYS